MGLDDGPSWPVRGEKPYLTFHQDLVDYEDNQVVRANTRIPYFSTLTQLEDEGKERTDGGPVRGEKPYLGFHQGLVDYEDNQVVRANTRIPYASTLTQLDDGPS